MSVLPASTIRATIDSPLYHGLIGERKYWNFLEASGADTETASKQGVVFAEGNIILFVLYQRHQSFLLLAWRPTVISISRCVSEDTERYWTNGFLQVQATFSIPW